MSGSSDSESELPVYLLPLSERKRTIVYQENHSEPNHQTKKRKLSASNVKEDEITQIRKRLFYEDTGTKFKFKDGKTINFDKKLLCWRSRSPVFDKLCFGAFNQDIIEIEDYDYETFQLFLNCIMGFSELTRETAEEIFPLVCKYLMEKWIDKCAIVLKPTEMDENICHLLNMAFFYNQPKLCSVVKDYIVKEGSPYALLENERFSMILSEDSYLEIIKWVKIDSYLLKVIAQWCDDGLKVSESLKSSEEPEAGSSKHQRGSLKEYLHELKLIEHFKIDLFESGSLLYEFIKSNLGKDMFSPDEVGKYFISRQDSPLKKCKWIRKKGQYFTEEYGVHDLQLYNYSNIVLKFGKMVTYVSPNLNLSCTIRKYYLNQAGNSDSETGILTKDQSFTFSLSRWQRFGDSSNVRFEIKYMFGQDCRILVTNIKPKLNTGNNETAPSYTDSFYFTNKIFRPKT